jgi:hypothetical protein
MQIPSGGFISWAMQWQIFTIDHHNLSFCHISFSWLLKKLLNVSKPRFVFIVSAVNSIKIRLLNFFSDGTTLTITNGAIIKLADWCDFSSSTGEEGLIG